MFSTIRAYSYVALRLPSDTVKVEQITPNNTVSLGKYGSFHTNSIIGRPYYLTFELLENTDSELRIVSASEIHAETLLEEAEPDLDGSSTPGPASASVSTPAEFNEYGPTTSKTNINITDAPTNQKLTYAEIEALKSDQMQNPRELINKIMANHTQLDQKTVFSLAKYTLRKHKKYMRRFTVLPLDVGTLTDFMMEEKDFSKIMEIRNETIGLITSWANIHASSSSCEPGRRYLVVDDTGGLVVGAIAERMGLLHHVHDSTQLQESTTDGQDSRIEAEQLNAATGPHSRPIGRNTESAETDDTTRDDNNEQSRPPRSRRPFYSHDLAVSNTITLVHANQQPNLSLLRYFSFDPSQAPSTADPNPHPLHTHLHSLSWLQLLHPNRDMTYAKEPPVLSPNELSAKKANHRTTYHRKRRRWARTRQIVDAARAGNFDGLIVASFTDPVGILGKLVPLVKGGGMVVCYANHIEGLMDVCDAYSTGRRTAFLNEKRARGDQLIQPQSEGVANGDDRVLDDEMDLGGDGLDVETGGEDERFPVDPTLLLNPTIHHSVARPWQVLPGRTHPMMMGKGGAEGGYVLVSTRVIPVQGQIVQARGRQGRQKKRATEDKEPIDEEYAAKRGKVDDGLDV